MSAETHADQDDLHDVSVPVVVVYFRTPLPLIACLESLRTQTCSKPEIVVVDNSSAVDERHTRPAEGDDWYWLPMSHNSGFAAACNAGVRQGIGKYVLILNGDVVLAPDACTELLAAIERDPQAAVVGPRIIDADDQIELSAREFPSIRTGLVGRSSLITRVLRWAGTIPPNVSMALQGQSCVVDWVSGACMLIRREAFDRVGGFDEGYWMYWEDADLCRRLVERGYHARFVPTAVVHHATGSSGRSPVTIRAFHDSAVRYFEKHLARSRISKVLGRAVLSLRCRVALAHAMLEDRQTMRSSGGRRSY